MVARVAVRKRSLIKVAEQLGDFQSGINETTSPSPSSSSSSSSFFFFTTSSLQDTRCPGGTVRDVNACYNQNESSRRKRS